MQFIPKKNLACDCRKVLPVLVLLDKANEGVKDQSFHILTKGSFFFFIILLLFFFLLGAGNSKIG